MNIKIKISDYNSTQFDLPNELTTNIDNYFNKLIDKKDIADKKYLPDYAGNGIVTSKAHITVLYGIKDGMEDIIKNVVESRDQISVVLGKTKVFENKFLNYDVLYIEVMSLGIRRLKSALEKRVEYVKSPFSFTPHISIAYLAKGNIEKYKNNDAFEGTNLKLHALTYFPTEGNNKIYHLNY